MIFTSTSFSEDMDLVTSSSVFVLATWLACACCHASHMPPVPQSQEAPPMKNEHADEEIQIASYVCGATSLHFPSWLRAPAIISNTRCG